MGNEGIKRVLVVEDEWLIAAWLNDRLSAWGFDVVGPAPSVKTALGMVETESFDCALLDLSLRSERSFPVAERLQALEIPFLFLTGYQSRDLPEAFIQVPIVAKPINETDLQKALGPLLADTFKMSA